MEASYKQTLAKLISYEEIVVALYSKEISIYILPTLGWGLMSIQRLGRCFYHVGNFVTLSLMFQLIPTQLLVFLLFALFSQSPGGMYVVSAVHLTGMTLVLYPFSLSTEHHPVFALLLWSSSRTRECVGEAASICWPSCCDDFANSFRVRSSTVYYFTVSNRVDVLRSSFSMCL